MPTPAAIRLVHLTPRPGASGVGDYAADFEQAVAPYVDSVEVVHYEAPRHDRAIDMIRFRRHLRGVLGRGDGTTVLHTELSGGSATPFWALAGLRGVTMTATVHDAPRPIWMPALTRLVGRYRFVSPAIHRGLRPFWEWLERRVVRRAHLFALTTTGADEMRAMRMGATVGESRLVVPRRTAVPPIWERPLAVGLFGHVYRGKGFELIPALREALGPDVLIRVAGRGTEDLEPLDGVEIVGPVDGPDEDAFFASIRTLLLPYGRRAVGGRIALPASATHLQGIAYDTPSIALPWPTMDELAADGACTVVHGGVAELAAAAEQLVRSDAAMRAEHDRIRAYRASLTDEAAVAPYLAVWGAP